MKNELSLRVSAAQINCTVGDLEGNASKIKEYIQKAKDLQSDIVSFPELAITGYPPDDLLSKPKFIKDNLKKLKQLCAFSDGITVIIGFVDLAGQNLYNAAAVMRDGKIIGVYRKKHLPNYGVFDEKRYFSEGANPPVFFIANGSSGSEGVVLGVNICEDIWHFEDTLEEQVNLGAGCIINISASPYHAGKIKERQAVLRKQSRANHVAIVYTNLVGGQDELVFDGQSMAIDSSGKIIARAAAFKEELFTVDIKVLLSQRKARRGWVVVPGGNMLDSQRPPLNLSSAQALEPIEEIYKALLLGLRDYVAKNGFQKVVIGLSGGIDSALVAAIAVDALGKDNVKGVFMPSRYSSAESAVDAEKLAALLGIELLDVGIENIYKAYLDTLKPCFKGAKENIAEENLQARIRGNILMALSNKFGCLVLTTGNKSEMSTGYATLYGDMAGGFAVIKDVPKTLVYKLVQYRNAVSLVIPERIITKEPTAELKFNQKDSDTLPLYETLDRILKAYIEENRDLDKIAASGLNKDTVYKVAAMVDRSEYKRRQSPPGIKITPKAFGRDRRMPITNKYIG